MRAVLQRVLSASVTVDGEVVSSIGPGLLVLVGICATDGADDARWLAQKIVKARLFEAPSAEDADAAAGAPGKPWARSVESEGKQALFVSQFTLYGSFAKGNKPDLHRAMPPGPAKALYETFLAAARAAVLPPGGDDAAGREKVKDGVFGANMQVALVNDGPVTMLLDSQDRKG